MEWPTLAMLAVCYAAWTLGTTVLSAIALPLAMVVVTLATALHSSLTHEALHGHPFRSRFWNAAVVFPALSVVVPYLRFRDTHLAHHRDSILTDPYDDPESNYLDPVRWAALPGWARAVLRANNTLAGRLLIGPLVGTASFLAQDLAAMRHGIARVWLGWALHVPALGLVLWWMTSVASMPLWAWAMCVYAGLAILKIRTYLEHQAHESARGRTVIIEDRGLLAWLFLNNNLHVVHHMHAAVPWYRLPQLYFANRARYLDRNEGYRYRSYAEVFRRHFWRAKDPVPHPLWPKP
ncbi:fatty acid desaturase [Thalassococcus sp. CAU 1522]|uniref:Fatty acid desaturase n=1 Tax=Thalassococcus arenae TaxID=2851652 RepID=A0ABS6N3Y9_9RHOB|nr:fatty acid desaturase [Thalassococcus arenae]MBV2358729.1 fatty acid desaturase [Thalassococcus arenae]